MSSFGPDHRTADAAPARFRLRILAGPHAGVGRDLPPGSYTLGRGRDAALILADPDAAPVHVRLDLAPGSVTVHALGGDVVCDAGRVIAAGAQASFRHAVEIALGRSRIGVRPPTAARPLAPTLHLSAIAVAAAVIIGGLHLASRPQASGAAVAGPAPTAPLHGTAAPAEAVPPWQGPVPTAADALPALRAHLQSVGLAAEVRVTASGDTLTAVGTVGPDQAATWRAAQMWFDRTFGHRVLLVRAVQISTRPTPKLLIQSVYTGANPYVMGADGSRYAVGDRLESGWTVEAIEADRVVLSRDGERLALSY